MHTLSKYRLWGLSWPGPVFHSLWYEKAVEDFDLFSRKQLWAMFAKSLIWRWSCLLSMAYKFFASSFFFMSGALRGQEFGHKYRAKMFQSGLKKLLCLLHILPMSRMHSKLETYFPSIFVLLIKSSQFCLFFAWSHLADEKCNSGLLWNGNFALLLPKINLLVILGKNVTVKV